MDNHKVKELIQNTFDDVAKSYDINEYFTISAKRMVEIISNTQINNTQNLNILDLSSGTGNIAIALSKQYPTSSIHAVDISEEMLKVAKQKTKDEGILNITYYVQDVENLDLGDMKFDIITCGYGLFFYPEMDNVFKDIYNRLTKNGVFAFSTFTQEAFQPYGKMFLDLLSKDYDIKPPETIEKRLLETKDEIEQFVKQVPQIKYEINEIQIQYPMQINKWWDLLNTTGYQGLLTQLGNKYEEFETKYLDILEKKVKNSQIDFSADSFISIVAK